MSETRVKQVIIIRKDLGMRRGKEIAQGSHASLSFLTQRLWDGEKITLHTLPKAQAEWIKGNFTKVTLQVDSDDELQDIYNKARAVGLEAHIITDSGQTEFGGRPTRTAVAIGPDYSENIDEVTKDLKLY